jgi:uncharacterized sulfatase
MVNTMRRFLAALSPLLWTWTALALGVFTLSVGQWLSVHGSGTELVQMLTSDTLLLVRALPLWCLWMLPLLSLSPAWLLWIQGVLGTLLVVALAGLDLYFVMAGVPLGADLFAYSWQELRMTVAGAQVSIPPALLFALLVSLGLLWGSLWLQSRVARPVASSFTVALVLGVCLASSLTLPMKLATASLLGANKLQFLLGDVWEWRRSASVQAAAEYPFEHPETTPDTLGPFLDLDAQKPPNLVFVLVEGLGRSFSGPDARLGSFTPFLDELAKKSLYWENFLATQGRTFAVLPSVLGSLPFGPYGEQRIPHDNLLSLLQGQGYSLRYFTGTDLAFDHQGEFLASSGVHSFWSERDFVAPARKLSEWGYSDADLFQAVAQSPMPTPPSVTVVQTMSMHTPFVVLQPEKYLQKFESRMDALGLTQAQRESFRQQKDIYASILFTDDALRVFFDKVSARPEWKNTVWVITGDHRLPEIPMASRIERYHVPLIVYSPLLRTPLRIKALSSHFDIAPSLLAMLSHRYGMTMPQQVHWMGAGLDVHTQWRNLHTLPLKQTKTELSDYVSGEYYLAQDKLYSLQDGLATAPEEAPAVAHGLRSEFANMRAALARVSQGAGLLAQAGRGQDAIYVDAQRSLKPVQSDRQHHGVVVSGAQGRFDTRGQLTAQGLFSLQGAQDSPTFVPLLVLNDAAGRELAEASGQAMHLQAGQSQEVTLSLPSGQWPKGTYYLSWVVSHPQTGQSLGKGQYHVPVQR